MGVSLWARYPCTRGRGGGASDLLLELYSQAFHSCGHLMNPEPLVLERSFVHVVKAAEPVFAAVLSAVFAGSVMALPVYASLIPVRPTGVPRSRVHVCTRMSNPHAWMLLLLSCEWCVE